MGEVILLIKMLGTLLLMLSVGTFASETEPVLLDSSLTNVSDFTIGLISGLGSEVGVEEFVACSTSSYSAVSDLYSAYRHLYGKTFFDNLIVIEQIGNGLVNISQSLFECNKAINSELTAINQLIERITKHPEQFGQEILGKLLVNGNVILHEFELFLENFENNYFKSSGYHFGNALSMIIS